MNIKKIKIGIIGGGVMGEVMIKSFRQELKISGRNILVMDSNAIKLNKLSKKYKIKTTNNFSEMISSSKIIFLAIKPQQFNSVAKELSGQLSANQIIVSIMAGISLSGIKKKLAHKKVIRTMPNLAAQINSAVTLWLADKSISKADRLVIKNILSSFGYEMEVYSDNKIDSLTLVTGSGPAYLFYMAEILEKFTRQQGVSSTQAKKIVIEMISGAMVLYMQSSDDAEKLRKKVTSKGGVTEAMFDIIERKYQSNIIWTKAFENALRRSLLLKKKYE
ncbi:MAG: pyrroline-5-carboxylate reductase [bacterium]|nr:pyrroline-5-carboxylate reductase [bacterium]